MKGIVVNSSVLMTAVLLSVASGLAPAQERHPGVNSPGAVLAFDPSRDAAKDIDRAVAEAGKSGKRVLLDVGGAWCIWCRRLDSLFERRSDISAYMHRNYIVVKVNYSPENKNEKVLSRYPKVAGYPHVFVLDGEGRLLHSQDTGELEEGKGHSPDKVFAFLRKWAPKGTEKREVGE